MMLKVQIKKIKNTCIFFDSVLFRPVETKGDVDYYELPCELQRYYDIKIIHFPGDSLDGVEAVIDGKGKSAFKSIISEAKSFDIDLYYCEMTASIMATKHNAFISIETSQIKNKDFIGSSSHCVLKIKQKINADLSNSITNFYPSKKVKSSIFLIEIASILLEFPLYIVVSVFATNNYIERLIWNEYDVKPYHYLIFLPLTVVVAILTILEIRRVIKRTLRID